MDTNFKSKQVGKPDEVLKNQIISAYSDLILNACALELQIEFCLNNLSGFGIDFFMDAINKDLETFIKTKYIELNKIDIPGISNARLIESNLLDINGMEEALKAQKIFNISLANARSTRLNYPLQKLYIDNETGWELTNDFYNEVEKVVCQYTQNEHQNSVLDKMEQFCSALNDLSELKVIRANRGKFEINNLINLIDCDVINQEKPFTVNSFIFRRSRFENIKEIV
jgi:hypothetical protein